MSLAEDMAADAGSLPSQDASQSISQSMQADAQAISSPSSTPKQYPGMAHDANGWFNVSDPSNANRLKASQGISVPVDKFGDPIAPPAKAVPQESILDKVKGAALAGGDILLNTISAPVLAAGDLVGVHLNAPGNAAASNPIAARYEQNVADAAHSVGLDGLPFGSAELGAAGHLTTPAMEQVGVLTKGALPSASASAPVRIEPVLSQPTINARSLTKSQQIPVTSNVKTQLQTQLSAVKGLPSAAPAIADQTSDVATLPNPAASITPELQGDPVPVQNAQSQLQNQFNQAKTPVPQNVFTTPGGLVPTPELQSVIDKSLKSGAQLDQTALQRHIEANSLPVPVQLTEGQAQANAAKFSNEMNNRGRFSDTLGATIDGQNNQLIQNFDAIRNQVAPDIAAKGNALDQMAVDAYKQMDAPVKADITAKYKAVEDANGGSLPVDGKAFVANVNKGLGSGGLVSTEEFLPSSVKNIVTKIGDSSTPMTLTDYQNLNTILGQELRKAQSANDGSAANAISVVKDNLENIPMSSEAAQVKPLLDSAVSAARARFQALKADPAYNAAINDGVQLGESSPVAGGFLNKYVFRNGAQLANVENMIKNLSNDPKNLQIISAGMVDHLKDSSNIDLRSNTGNVSQSGLNNSITALDQKLPTVLGDETAKTVGTLGNVARYTQQQTKGMTVNNSNTLSGALAEGAKGAVSAAINAKTGGLSGFAQSIFSNKAAASAAAKAIQPGAGINLKEYPR